MSEAARRFRIEGGAPRAQQAPALEFPAFEAPLALPVAAVTDDSSILEEIRAIRTMVSPLRSIIEGLSENYKAELAKVAGLRSDIGEIDDAIRGTKKELAAIKVGAHIGGVDVAASELATVVSQTEAATNDILAAAEGIETLAGAIQSETTLDAAKALATDIADKVTTIYMASNFQDLSGQRIARVVDTLNFIESRIHRMIEAWGGLQALHDLIEGEIQNKEEERMTEGAAALANGPMLDGAEDHVNQDDIDALFN